MRDQNKNYYILLGGPEHYDFFEHHERYSGDTWFWTMLKGARVGDICFVYMSAPVSRIVGQFEVTGEPFFHFGNSMFDSPKLRDQYVAEIGNVTFFESRPELTIKGLRQLFHDWGWPRYPRSKIKIPAEIIKPFLELIRKTKGSKARASV